MLLVPDSCIFVSAFMPNELDHARAAVFANELFIGKRRIVVPVILTVEVLSSLSRRFLDAGLDIDSLEDVKREIDGSPFISWKIIDRAFAQEAAHIGMKHRLRGMDAIFAATAIQYKLPLSTEDKAFKKANLPIPVYGLADVIKYDEQSK